MLCLRFYFFDFLVFKLICYYLWWYFRMCIMGFILYGIRPQSFCISKLIYGFTQLTQRLMRKIISTLKHGLTCHIRGHSSNTRHLRKQNCHIKIFDDKNSDFKAFGAKNNVWEIRNRFWNTLSFQFIQLKDLNVLFLNTICHLKGPGQKSGKNVGKYYLNVP
jgi:hypothetical protein